MKPQEADDSVNCSVVLWATVKLFFHNYSWEQSLLLWMLPEAANDFHILCSLSVHWIARHGYCKFKNQFLIRMVHNTVECLVKVMTHTDMCLLGFKSISVGYRMCLLLLWSNPRDHYAYFGLSLELVIAWKRCSGLEPSSNSSTHITEMTYQVHRPRDLNTCFGTTVGRKELMNIVFTWNLYYVH